MEVANRLGTKECYKTTVHENGWRKKNSSQQALENYAGFSRRIRGQIVLRASRRWIVVNSINTIFIQNVYKLCGAADTTTLESSARLILARFICMCLHCDTNARAISFYNGRINLLFSGRIALRGRRNLYRNCLICLSPADYGSKSVQFVQ